MALAASLKRPEQAPGTRCIHRDERTTRGGLVDEIKSCRSWGAPVLNSS